MDAPSGHSALPESAAAVSKRVRIARSPVDEQTFVLLDGTITLRPL